MIFCELTDIVDINDQRFFTLEHNILNLNSNDKNLVINIVFWFLRYYWHHGFIRNWHTETLCSGCVFLLKSKNIFQIKKRFFFVFTIVIF